ncbi:hypothetical protein niasHT_027646 [Heterodera trifolii]|uniref:Uncharacterized protein n=1 Tax=Heterodera trifolii TaxID=157864 RepID=A0ABD2K5D1_9BILA
MNVSERAEGRKEKESWANSAHNLAQKLTLSSTARKRKATNFARGSIKVIPRGRRERLAKEEKGKGGRAIRQWKKGKGKGGRDLPFWQLQDCHEKVCTSGTPFAASQSVPIQSKKDDATTALIASSN